MKILFDKYPIDIILCISCSVILIPVALLDVNGILRLILGLPFILFIPGYALIFALFPTKKTDKGIGLIERITLSLGFSMAIVPLIGLGLNYTSWGIRLESILLCIFVFVIGMGFLAIYRWLKVNPKERYTIHFDLPQLKSKRKLDLLLNVLIIISIIIAAATITYVIITPKQGEKFTEFYLLGTGGNTTDFPENISIGKNYSVILGVANHEYKTVDYTIEVWLINQSTYYNQSEDRNKTAIQNMWFMDKILTTLDHTDAEIGKTKEPQWEYTYSFSINRTGSFKLTFLLFTTPTKEYIKDLDYKNMAEQKTNTTYRETHLWINVN